MKIEEKRLVGVEKIYHFKISIEKISKVLNILPNLKIIRTLEECKNFNI
jgi:hypothetical protein